MITAACRPQAPHPTPLHPNRMCVVFACQQLAARPLPTWPCAGARTCTPLAGCAGSPSSPNNLRPPLQASNYHTIIPNHLLLLLLRCCCGAASVQVSFGPYKLGALVGLEISATNFQQKERMLLQKLVQSAGGTYSAELFKGRTTHLMCKIGTGKKYR